MKEFQAAVVSGVDETTLARGAELEYLLQGDNIVVWQHLILKVSWIGSFERGKRGNGTGRTGRWTFSIKRARRWSL